MAFCALTQYTADELRGQPITLILDTDTQIRHDLAEALRTGTVAAVERTCRLRNGIPIVVQFSATTLYDAHAQPVSIVCQIATPPPSSAGLLPILGVALEAAASIIFITDVHGTIHWVNTAFTRSTGYSAAEAIGQTPRLLKSHHHSTAFYQNIWQTILSGCTWQGEVTNRRKDNSIYIGEMMITPVVDPNGTITHFVSIQHDITVRKQAELQREQSLALLQATLESTADAILVVDKQRHVLAYNRKFVDMWQLPPDWIHRTAQQPLSLLVQQVQEPEEFTRRIDELLHHPELEGHDLIALHDGRIIECDATIYWVGNTIAGRVWNFRDVTKRQQDEAELMMLKQVAEVLNQALTPEQALRSGLALIAVFMHAHSGWIWMIDEHQQVRMVASYNPPAALASTDHTRSWALCHCLRQALIHEGAEKLLPTPCQRLQRLPAGDEGDAHHVCVPIRVRERLMGTLNLIVTPTRRFDRLERRLLTAVSDQIGVAIERLRLLDAVQKLATTDPLTELYNRRHFYTLCQREVERAHCYTTALTAMMVDVDNFKLINDNYGHSSGDAVLRVIAQTFRKVLRTSDILCRYGGEEFAILLPETSLAAAEQVAERLRTTIAQLPIKVNNETIQVTISLGVAALAPSSADLESLLNHADQALYVAKRKGRNCTICAE